MKLGALLYVSDSNKWRNWLEKNHDKKSEIWLIYYKKHTSRASIPYDDAVCEALCFGWIDSTVKGIDSEKYAQRFSPRNPKSKWSEPNVQRVKRLIKMDKMTPAGLAVFKDDSKQDFKIPVDVGKILKSDNLAWKNFQKFPKSYQKIRISWIDTARKRPKEFKKRLGYFINLTAKNKKFGILQNPPSM